MIKMKNVILITIDSLRADHLSCSGYHRNTTPHLDGLAKRGILFSQAISNGASTPTSFRAILTSTSLSMYDDDRYLSKYRVTIQEVLKRAGYSTAAYHSNPWLSSLAGFDRGFDTFGEILGLKKDVLFEGMGVEGVRSLFYRFLFRSRLMKFKLNKLYKFSRGEPFARANTLNEMAISWLKKHPKKFFVWLHYMDVHTPYVPPKECLKLFSPSSQGIIKDLGLYLKIKQSRRKDIAGISEEDLKLLIDLYDAEIRYVDTQVGSFLNELRETGVFDETLIIITADHGEEFFEHGAFGHAKQHLYDELLRVPLIIYAPEIGEDVVIKEQVELLSIGPTVIEAVGLGREVDNFMGRSLVPLIKGVGKRSTGVISEASRSKISYREPEWKFILDKESEKYEIYNLKEDSKEEENIAEVEKEKVKEFQQKILYHERMVEREKMRRRIKKLKFLKKV